MMGWFGVMLLLVSMLWGCGPGGSRIGPAVAGGSRAATEAEATQARFAKGENGVITDRLTGLEWYVNPSPDTTWHQAKAWAEGLTVAGGGWRLPSLAELKGIYQKGAGDKHMDPLFQAQGAWVWSGDHHHPWSAWGFAFYSGLEGWHGKDYACGRLAFAVRSHR